MESGGKKARSWLAASVSVYVVLGVVSALQPVGLQYDEALHERGAVDLLRTASAAAGKQPGDLLVFGRIVRLMVAPYVGAVKDYLLAPQFALFGTNPHLSRLTAVALTTVGLYGIGSLIRQELSDRLAVVVVLLMAVNPSLIHHTVFDNSPTSPWMAVLGAVALAMGRLLRRGDRSSAAMVGLSLGVGVWARLNFAWLVLASAVALVVVLRKQVLSQVRTLAWIAGGAVAGSLPLLLYELTTRLRSFHVDYLPHQPVTRALIETRASMVVDTVLADPEHRRMIWAGPPAPRWQWLFTATILVIAGVVALVAPGADRRLRTWARVAALATLGFAGLMLTSSLLIAHHHLVTLVPLVCLLLTLAGYMLVRWRPPLIPVVALCCLVQLALGIQWDVRDIAGLRATHGRGMWSDAHDCVAAYLARAHPPGPVQLLDWGFGQNLHVLSEGRVPSQEAFWGADEESGAGGLRWSEAVRTYSTFVIHTEQFTFFPPAGKGFLRALSESGRTATTVRFSQRGGRALAVVYELDESSAPARMNTTERAVARLKTHGCPGVSAAAPT